MKYNKTEGKNYLIHHEVIEILFNEKLKLLTTSISQQLENNETCL